MELKLKVTPNCDYSGDLLFESLGKKVTVHYQFGKEHKLKSLENRDMIDITFNAGKNVFEMKGIYPKVLETVPSVVKYIWSLAKDLIYNNTFYMLASNDLTPIPTPGIESISEEISGIVPDGAKILFEIEI